MAADRTGFCTIALEPRWRIAEKQRTRCSIIVKLSNSIPLIFVLGKKKKSNVEINATAIYFTGSTSASHALIFAGMKKQHNISSMPLSSKTAMVSSIQLE